MPRRGKLDMRWRDGRVAEGARLESVYTARYPGFESLSLRQNFEKPRKSAGYAIYGLFLFIYRLIPTGKTPVLTSFIRSLAEVGAHRNSVPQYSMIG
jgi:hypothetical protein